MPTGTVPRCILRSREDAEQRLKNSRSWQMPYLHEKFFPRLLNLTLLPRMTPEILALDVLALIHVFADHVKSPGVIVPLCDWADDFIDALVADQGSASRAIRMFREAC